MDRPGGIDVRDDDLVELHTPEAHDVIACELAACILGQRERVELRVDFAGHMARLSCRIAALQLEIGRKIAEALRPAVASIGLTMAALDRLGSDEGPT